MKNLFLLVFVILVAGSTLYAQIQKGIVRLGGTFIADYSDNTINNRGLQLFSLSTAPSIYFNITPNVGVFISNKWLVGGSIEMVLIQRGIYKLFPKVGSCYNYNSFIY